MNGFLNRYKIAFVKKHLLVGIASQNLGLLKYFMYQKCGILSGYILKNI